jgi:sulfate adenylyltransferase
VVKTSGTARTLLATDVRRDELRRAVGASPSVALAGRSLTELEALLVGFLSPLCGYSVPGAPPRVLDGKLPPDLGLRLDVPAELGSRLETGQHVSLRDPEGVILAVLRADECAEYDGRWWLGGPVEGVEIPAHDDFSAFRLTPTGLAERIAELGHRRVLAFVAGQVLHAGTRAALLDAAERDGASLLVLVGSEADEYDDAAHFAHVRATLISAGLMPSERTIAAVIPLPGDNDERVKLQRGVVIASNAGASALIVDRSDTTADGLDAAKSLASRLGLEVMPFRSFSYSRTDGRFVASSGAGEAALESAPSSEEILSDPHATPDWLLRPEERDALATAHVPRASRGFTVFFTGLSGSGKSTIARALRIRLMERTGRPITLLDGDRVRRHLSSELGFSREHRNLNILRIGWVAAEITRHGGIAICAPIAPYEAVRRDVRRMVESAGGFILVHVATPLETCEARDRKGLYARARAGLVPQFTGVSDPYEPPSDAAVTIDTREMSVEAACAAILDALVSQDYLLGHP